MSKRFDQHSQIGEVLDQLPDACLELDRPDYPHLETEVAQGFRAGRPRWQGPSIAVAAETAPRPHFKQMGVCGNNTVTCMADLQHQYE
jgi:hypothetical protein